jgi:hypothetical protein
MVVKHGHRVTGTKELKRHKLELQEPYLDLHG